MNTWGITFSQKEYFVYLALVVLLIPLALATLRLQKKFRREWNFPLSPRFRGLKTALFFVGIVVLWIAMIGPQWGQ